MILSLINQKGGVGKTTSAINIAQSLVLKGYKVLLVDADPQCDLTSSLGIFDEGYTIFDLLNFKKISDLEDLKIEDNLYLIQGYSDILSFKLKLETLKKPLSTLDKLFDYIVVDCQPQPVVASRLTLNECVLIATDSVIIPLDVNYNSIKGTLNFVDSIDRIKVNHNPNLKILGMFFTQVNTRTKLYKEYADFLITKRGDLVFDTFIHRDEQVKSSQNIGKSVYMTNAKSKAALDYITLTEEILNKL